jgi:hypothetical protein
MSSSYLEADLSLLASTIRARLQRHRSHRLKVYAYKWLDTALGQLQPFALTRLGLGRKIMNIAYSNCHRLSEIASGLGRESPIQRMVSVEQGVDAIVARVGR